MGASREAREIEANACNPVTRLERPNTTYGPMNERPISSGEDLEETTLIVLLHS
jgi:hypothetical protein